MITWVHLHCIPEYQSKLFKHFWACPFLLFSWFNNQWLRWRRGEGARGDVVSPCQKQNTPSASSISCPLSLLTLELLITMFRHPSIIYVRHILWLWHPARGPFNVNVSTILIKIILGYFGDQVTGQPIGNLPIKNLQKNNPLSQSVIRSHWSPKGHFGFLG